MKQPGFKVFFSDRWTLFKASVVSTFQTETAYWTENWANLISTTFYTLMTLLFLHILYANVDSIAGYTRNEMLFFFLVAQLSFYTTWAFSMGNLEDLIRSVNRGELDLILTKPIPALFYISLKNINLMGFLRDGILPSLAILIAIDWGAFQFSVPRILAGFVLFVCGQICFHVVQFFLAIPVFWLGQNKVIFSLFWVMEDFAGRIPFEGFTRTLKLLFSVFIPIGIVVGFTSSVILGKSDPLLMLAIALPVTLLSLIVRHLLWQKALKNYTSASS